MNSIIKISNNNRKAINYLSSLIYNDYNVEKINDALTFLDEWNESFDFKEIEYGNLKNDIIDEINLIFWITNVLVYKKKINDRLKYEILTKIIFYFIKDNFLYENEKILNVIFNFHKHIFFEIERQTIFANNYFFEYSKKEELEIEICKKIIDNFMKYNNRLDLYSYEDRDKDFKKNPRNLHNLFEKIYYRTLEKEEYKIEQIIKDPLNYYNRRFFFILLNRHFTQKNDSLYNKKFKINDYYDDEYIFIKTSKMKSNEEFYNFIKIENELLKDKNNKIQTLYHYYKVYKFYNNEFELDNRNEIISEIKSYDYSINSKVMSSDQLEEFYFNRDRPLNKNFWVFTSTIYDRQVEKYKVISKYNLIQQTIFLYDEFINIITKNWIYFDEFDLLLKEFDDIRDIQSEISNLNFNSKEVKNIFILFNFSSKNIDLLKININFFTNYLISFIKANEANVLINKFVSKYKDISKDNKQEIYQILKEFDSCFKNINFDINENSLFFLSKLNGDFLPIIEKIFYKSDEIIDLEEIFTNFNRVILNVKKIKNINTDILEKIRFKKYYDKFSILSNNIKENNIWVFKKNIFFKFKSNYISNYFDNNLEQEEKIKYFLIFLRDILSRGYKYWVTASNHLNNVFPLIKIFDFLYKEKENIKNLTLKELDLFETKETFINYLDNIEISQIVYELLLVTMMFSKIEIHEEKTKKIFNFFKNKEKWSSIEYIISNFYYNLNYLINDKNINIEKEYEKIKEKCWYIYELISFNIYFEDYDYNSPSFYLKDTENLIIRDRFLNENWIFNNDDDIEIAIKKLFLFNAFIIFESLNKNDHKIKEIKYAYDLINELKEIPRFKIFKNIEIFSKKIKNIYLNIEILNKL